MIEALGVDYIKTARAKGVKGEDCYLFPCVPQCANSHIVTLVVGWFIGIFSGSIIIESLFGLKGMGNLMISSLRTADFDVIILIQVFYVFISLLGHVIHRPGIWIRLIPDPYKQVNGGQKK